MVILKGDKDSSAVIMNRLYYLKKLEKIIEEEVKKGTYKKREDTTRQEFRKFKQGLIYIRTL